MTAMTLDELSGGRCLLGLGLSGPQVVEGWHGVAYGKPLGKTREYVEIVRKIFKREEPLVHHGEHYQIPYAGPDATGLGKPLKSILHPRPDIPIYLASIGPKNVALTAEIADGWLPFLFSPRHYEAVYAANVNEGFAAAGGGKGYERFDIAPSTQVIIDDDLESARDRLKPMLALYIGGMGAKGKNFYNELTVRYGYEEAAETIQNLYLSGQKAEAIAAVPDDFVDDVALVGPAARVRDRLQMWRDSPITTLNVIAYDIATLRQLAEWVL
jgi:F420-dependent oxidoreductase-like protein